MGCQPNRQQALGGFAGFTLGQDYVLFQNVLPIAGAITISFTGGNPVRDVGVFNGFQLTYVPEPATLGLLGISVLGFLRVASSRGNRARSET